MIALSYRRAIGGELVAQAQAGSGAAFTQLTAELRGRGLL